MGFVRIYFKFAFLAPLKGSDGVTNKYKINNETEIQHLSRFENYIHFSLVSVNETMKWAFFSKKKRNYWKYNLCDGTLWIFIFSFNIINHDSTCFRYTSKSLQPIFIFVKYFLFFNRVFCLLKFRVPLLLFRIMLDSSIFVRVTSWC